MKIARGFLLVVLACSLLLAGVSTAVAAAAITVTDFAGRTVEVPADPQRIICLGPGMLRLIVYLEKKDVVVGVESMEKRYPGSRPYMLAHPELADLPPVGPGGAAAINKEPDLEAVLKVAPELIFVTYMEPSKADVLSQKLGIPVVVLSYGDLALFDDLVFKSLQLAGKILGAEKRAGEVIQYISAAREDLRRRTRDIGDDAKPAVYVGGLGARGSHGIESTNTFYTPFEWLGARNAARQVTNEGQVFIGKENLLNVDPDVIFLDGAGLPLVKEDYAKKPEFYKALKAFREKRVYVLLPFNYYTTNIETVVADAYAVGKILYPERFADVDPEAKTDETYQFMVGKPVYDLMKKDHGVIGRPADFFE